MTFLVNDNKESKLALKLLDNADKSSDMVLSLIKNEKLKLGVVAIEAKKHSS